ncbi:hypothetical protein GCM10010954_27540 [Halobacillus andaensis]|uniref:Transposase DDE domain-containing protein n=1 Tax=Halobacillus andaensis TaxID=1176239 RepID=A0A917B9M3_HALAA|nr:hypothetical protein GCM10010954_27540 [Halobacillus andaensis]
MKRIDYENKTDVWEEKVREQALMTAVCQNMKKIALHLAMISWREGDIFRFRSLRGKNKKRTPFLGFPFLVCGS